MVILTAGTTFRDYADQACDTSDKCYANRYYL